MDRAGSDRHYAHAISTAIEALKALLLVNGGAATALIALQSKNEAAPGLPILLFGTAALMNALTLVLGYFSQLNYANLRLAIECDLIEMRAASHRRHSRIQWAAILILLASLGVSGAGLAAAYTTTGRQPALKSVSERATPCRAPSGARPLPAAHRLG